MMNQISALVPYTRTFLKENQNTSTEEGNAIKIELKFRVELKSINKISRSAHERRTSGEIAFSAKKDEEMKTIVIESNEN